MGEQRAAPVPGRPSWSPSWSIVTCFEDGHGHAVADSVLAEGGIGAGRFPARCGRLIAPVALSAPDGPPCPLCG